MKKEKWENQYLKMTKKCGVELVSSCIDKIIDECRKELLEEILKDIRKLKINGNYTIKGMEAIYQEGYNANKRDVLKIIKSKK